MMVDYITAAWLLNPINIHHTHTSKSEHAHWVFPLLLVVGGMFKAIFADSHEVCACKKGG